jgi:hypothetical protein
VKIVDYTHSPITGAIRSHPCIEMLGKECSVAMRDHFQLNPDRLEPTPYGGILLKQFATILMQAVGSLAYFSAQIEAAFPRASPQPVQLGDSDNVSLRLAVSLAGCGLSARAPLSR